MMKLSISVFALLAAASLFAASTQVWEISEYNDFLPGDFESVALDKDGALRLGPKLETLYESDQPVVWAIAIGPDSSIYVGTGHQGGLYRIDPAGKVERIWKAEEIEIFAVAVGKRGEVYAAASPKGKVYRIDKSGKAEEFFDPRQDYIWSLALSEDGTLFVGTGGEGRIFAVDSSGKGEEYYASGQRHVVSLGFDSEGRLLAGADPNGVLYRIESRGKAFALYDSELPEIRSLTLGPDGEIFAAAMGGGMSLTTQAVQAVSAATTIRVTATAEGPGGGSAAPGAAATLTPTTPTTQTAATPQPVVVYGGEKAALLRIRPDLSVEKIFSSREENILAVTAAEPGSAELFFATDRSGRIYRLDSAGRVSLVAETGKQQVTALAATPNGLIAATAHSGGVFRLGRRLAAEGVYRSGVKDAGGVARWGRLSWEGGGEVEFRTRSGNSARPDQSWSEWSKPIRGAAGGSLASPAARYLQWEARLRPGGEEAARIERVRVVYLPQNSPPIVRAVTVKTAAAGSGTAAASSSSADAASDSSAAYSITVTADGGSPVSPATSTVQQRLAAVEKRKMAIEWTAEDPDGDELIAEIFFLGEGETVWKSIKKDIKQKRIILDSDRLADGRYRFRVRVSDRPANPPETARTAEKTSNPVLIDHTPPRVRLIELDGRRRARFEAADAASMLAAAEYSIDAGEWTRIRADDGLSDSSLESFTISLDGLDPGEHLLTLRVRDRVGNVGLGKAVVR